MNKYIVIAIVVLLLALDWAALHDILGGLEPDYTQEYLMIAASLVIFFLLGLNTVVKKRK